MNYLLRLAAEAMTYASPTTRPNAKGTHTPKLSTVAGTICCIKLSNPNTITISYGKLGILDFLRIRKTRPIPKSQKFSFVSLSNIKYIILKGKSRY